jgi:hypothetical protein
MMLVLAIVVFSSIASNQRILKVVSFPPKIITDFHFHLQSIGVAEEEDDNITRLCDRREIQNGSWQPVTLDAPPYVPRTVHLRCFPEEVYQQGYWNTYEWQPNSAECNVAKWNRGDFCRLLRRATVLIIGDSLSWEHYRSLNHLLGNRGVSQSEQHESKSLQGNIVHYVCPQKQTRIVFRRDDLLTNVSQAIFEEGTFPQVIVMNRGAHFQNDTLLLTGMRKVVKELQAWKAQCKAFGIKCHFFWRTSVPGHPQCDQPDMAFDAPVNDLAQMEAFVGNRSLYDNRTILYHWYDYQHQNLLVEDLLTRELSPPNQQDDTALQILDAYYLNLRRPDQHRAHQGDCLHNCYPGKMDVYSQLMLHYLRQQRKKQDIDELMAWQEEFFKNGPVKVTSLSMAAL